MPRYSLIESTPPVPEGIACRYFLVDREQVGRRRILVVAFEGEYPDGSRGREHGAYIASASLHGVNAFDAHCLILDLRGLAYRWGNTLLAVFQDVSQFKDGDLEPEEPPFPIVAVTSDRCREGFLSLVTPVGQAAPEWHFEDMDAAIDHALKKVEEWFAY